MLFFILFFENINFTVCFCNLTSGFFIYSFRKSVRTHMIAVQVFYIESDVLKFELMSHRQTHLGT